MNAANRTLDLASNATSARATPSAAANVLALLESLRPQQWTKNLVIFTGIAFVGLLFDPGRLVKVAMAFGLFCLVSSAVYLFNDLIDVEKDRAHPEKRHRPLAAGRVRPGVAAGTSAALGGGGLIAGWALAPAFGLVLTSYVGLQLAYSLWLKHFVVLDVMTIAAGFVLRAISGAVVIAVPVSPWLYVCALLLALFLALGKRRHELVLLREDAANHRPILDHYPLAFVDQLLMVVTTAALLAYMLYTFSAENLPANHAMMLTIPLPVYGMFRYLYLIYARGDGGAPDAILLRDRPLLATVALWGVVSILILYIWR